jgi:hypothetical protein
MRKDMRITLLGIIGSILVSGGTIAIAIVEAYNTSYSYYPIVVFFGGILLIYAVFASLLDEQPSSKVSK